MFEYDFDNSVVILIYQKKKYHLYETLAFRPLIGSIFAEIHLFVIIYFGARYLANTEKQ